METSIVLLGHPKKEKKKVTLKMKKNCGGVLNIEDTPH
jgi:hypothetical protein